MPLLRHGILAIGFALPLLAAAQLDTPALRGAAARAPDLTFPAKTSEFSIFTTPSMALSKPAGDGPFPALVLQHQCGGLGHGKWQNQSMLEWARRAVRHGYVALLIDSLGPRGVDSVCMGPQGGVTPMRGVRDALQAAAYLGTFDFVDKTRIAHAGYSWGAMVGVGLSGKHWAEALGDGARFNAAVAFYPVCATLRPRNGSPFDVLNPDIDRPLLVLMGADDTEAVATECVSRLQAAKDSGAPFQWHVYPDTTHCWDCENLNNFSKTDGRGNHVVYRYDAQVTADAERRMFEFLDQALQVKHP
jgi:dienelactone hydrolase